MKIRQPHLPAFAILAAVLLCAVAAALMTLPAAARAADGASATTKPSASTQPDAGEPLKFYGTISAIDKDAKTFVPPYNQPFDYPRGFSVSLSERREARPHRNGLAEVCRALRETGYALCRVAYRPLPQQAAERLLRRRLERPARPRTIAGLTCLRLNTPGGFGPESVALLRRCVREGGIATAYGHPHSLHGDDFQHERYLVEFLREARRLADEGSLSLVLPGQFVNGFGASAS